MGTCALFSRHIIEAKFLLEATGLIAAVSASWIKMPKVFKIRKTHLRIARNMPYHGKGW
jgi:hypothetical protein